VLNAPEPELQLGSSAGGSTSLGGSTGIGAKGDMVIAGASSWLNEGEKSELSKSSPRADRGDAFEIQINSDENTPDSHLVWSCSAGAIGGVASAANYCLPVVKPQRSAEGDSRQYRHTCRECLKAP
jgi:hypothetical protein